MRKKHLQFRLGCDKVFVSGTDPETHKKLVCFRMTDGDGLAYGDRPIRANRESAVITQSVGSCVTKKRE